MKHIIKSIVALALATSAAAAPKLNETKDGLVCDACKLLYEIKDDIPIMLIDEAKPL